jgi:dipeptidyl aminopeptidase/acylaminoacyl peptidase
MTKNPITPNDLFAFTLVGDAQISPDGTRIAYVVKCLDKEKNEYVSNIFLWENGESRQYTAGDKDSTPRWSPDGRWLAFLSGRDEKTQIFLMPTGGGEALRLTEQKLGAGTPVWSPDSASIAFVGAVLLGEEPEDEKDKEKPAKTHIFERAVYKANGRGLIDDRRSHIFVIDTASKEMRQLTDGDYNDGGPAWSPDGLNIAFHADRSADWDLRAKSDIWIASQESGTTPRRLTDGQGVWTDPIFSPDGSRIAFVGFPKPEGVRAPYYPQLWTIPRGGGQATNLLAGTDLAAGGSVSGDWSVAGEGDLDWNEEGIFFIVSESGTSNVYHYGDQDTEKGIKASNRGKQGTRKGTLLRRVTEGRRQVMDFSITGGTIAYTSSDTTHPAEVFRTDMQTGAHAKSKQAKKSAPEEQLTSHNAEVLNNRCVVQPERTSFAGADGEEIEGWLMRPAGYQEGKRYPLILYIHGGPTAAYGETFFHEFQSLAAAGFGLFYCNPHGSSSYGCEFQESIVGDWGNLDFQDMMAALDLIGALPWVDSKRIGVAGGSYGGFLTNWLISHTDRFAAACTERGICNHVSQGGTSDWAAYRGERLGGTPERDAEFLWDRSPLKYVANVKTPTLIVHSERDDRCPIEEAEQWFMALKRLRVPVRFIRFPEETHELSRGGKPSRRLERLNHIQEWFREKL